MTKRKLTISLIGMGAGNPRHLTLEAIDALNDADLVLIPQKGEEKSDLAELRQKICDIHLRNAPTVRQLFALPTRDPGISDYGARVEAWHDAIAECWRRQIDLAPEAEKVALLVWGDPSIYDSTLRIARRLEPAYALAVKVVPGITAIQSLAAAHGIAVNEVNGPFLVTTGRRLRDEGWPRGVDTLIVMLDGECSFQHLEPAGIDIYWSAYLGLPEEFSLSGRLEEVGEEIISRRAVARKQHGWLMDTYLLRRGPDG